VRSDESSEVLQLGEEVGDLHIFGGSSFGFSSFAAMPPNGTVEAS